MSNICKTVSLRTRKIKDGHMLSYYLDYYPGYRDESTMKVIRHESLGIYIYAKPKNQMEQKYNLNLTARAEAIRCRRFEAIVNERYDFFDKEKMKGDFLAYFKKLADKKNSKWQHVYMHFLFLCSPCGAVSRYSRNLLHKSTFISPKVHLPCVKVRKCI